ncbi:YceI family protein [Pacificimonas sp. ICDLI1SI03]
MRSAFIASSAAILLTLALPAQGNHHEGDSEAAVAAASETLSTAQSMASGTYSVDPGHTLASFTLNHLGISSYTGQFGNPSGSLTIDPANPAQASVDITFPVADVSTTSSELDEHLQSDDFFDAANHPNIRFVSSNVSVDGAKATVTGDLTMHGVTKPVTLNVTLFGAGENPMSKAPSLGFTATTTINRSEWGLTTFLPALGDEVELTLQAAFEQKTAN